MSVRPLAKKGEGWWVVDYYPEGRKGRRRQFQFKGAKGEALALEQELRRAPDAPMKVSPLVQDLVVHWLEWYQNEVATSTYKDARTSIAHWLPYFGHFKPANITRVAISNYKSARLQEITNEKAVERGEEPRYTKKRTVNKELSYLSSCLKWAAAHGHSNDLPFQIKGFPAKQTKAAIVKGLTPRQIDKMYEVIEPQYKLLFLLMADMGLRRDEAINVRAEDVDEYHETLSVVGKGSKQRIIPWLSERFINELLKALNERPSGYLSVNSKTGKPYNQIRKCISRAGMKAKIERDVNPHLLRHSCLTNLAMQGMSPHALQQIAGHSSIETTNKIYVNIRQDYVRDEAMKIRKGRAA